MGPMQATVTPRRSRGNSAEPKSAQKFRTVEELVKVTTSTRPSASASRSPAACSVAARVR